MILGIGFLVDKINPQIYEKLAELFVHIGSVDNANFILVDTYNSYKKLQVESWYSSVDNSSGIWLGGDIGSQILINVSNLSLEERKLDFPCLAFVVDKGNKTIIKHMVDKDDVNEE